MDERIFRYLKGRGTPEDEAEISGWRAASPDNEARYRLLESILATYAEREGQRRVPAMPSAPQISARAKWLSERSSARPKFSKRVGRLALSAASAAALAVVVLHSTGFLADRERDEFGAEEFVTGGDERAVIQLRDGTVVRIGPDSRLRVIASGEQREVFLTGRAYFAVAEAEGRAFTVRTSAREVRVLGTRFDLEVREQDMQLVVMEGVVEVGTQGRERARVGAGEMYRVMNGDDLPAVPVSDALRFVGWTGNFLAFQSTPLADALHEIEQHYGVPIEIRDPVLSTRVITGWFADRPLSDVLRVVCLAVAAHCTSEQGTILVSGADTHTPGGAVASPENPEDSEGR